MKKSILKIALLGLTLSGPAFASFLGFGENDIYTPEKFVRDVQGNCTYAIYADSAKSTEGAYEYLKQASVNSGSTGTEGQIYKTLGGSFSPSDHMDIFYAPLDPGSIESRYCERIFPENADQALSKGFDIPAGELHMSAEEISSAWNQYVKAAQNSPDKSAILNSAEWQPIMDMNLQAAKVWTDILNCNHDPENARAAYRANKNFCDDSGRNDGIKQELSELHGNIRTLLLSSQIKPYFGATVLPKVHPLFAEIVLETIVKHESVYDIDKAFSERVGWEMLYLSNDPVPDSTKSYYGFGKADYPFSETARLLVNGLALLDAAASDRCASWGLWPATTRKLIDGYDNTVALDNNWEEDSFEHAFGLNYKDGSLDNMTRTLKKKIADACGDREGTLYNIYGSAHPLTEKYDRDFVKEFRAIDDRY